MGVFADWVRPEIGASVVQMRTHGPFVVQRRDDLGWGGVRLTRHRGATTTTFTILDDAERSEIGLPCLVVHLRDDRTGLRYVVDTGLCGPGLPPNMSRITAIEGGG